MVAMSGSYILRCQVHSLVRQGEVKETEMVLIEDTLMPRKVAPLDKTTTQ